MRVRSFVIIALLAVQYSVYAASVRLESLEEFEPSRHGIFVNIHEDFRRHCQGKTIDLEEMVETALTQAGLRVTAIKLSQLEFAVSVKGLGVDEQGQCGVMVTSMVRQIPQSRFLRLQPNSKSRQFRLWENESVFTVDQSELVRKIWFQISQDVNQFNQLLNQH